MFDSERQGQPRPERFTQIAQQIEQQSTYSAQLLSCAPVQLCQQMRQQAVQIAQPLFRDNVPGDAAG